MAINAPFGSKKQYDPTPAGNHIARVYSIIHLGVLQGEYMGEPKETDTVRISFELPNKTKVFKEGEDPRPFVISQEYTLSMNEKAKLRKLVEGIEGVAFHDEEAASYNVLDLMGKTCLLNVIHKVSKAGNTYAQIASAAPLPEGIQAPEAVNDHFILDFDENWDEEKFNNLPEFLKDKIRSTRNYRLKNPNYSEINYPEVSSDDIPF